MKNRLVIGFHQASYDAIAKWTVDGDEMLLKLTDEGLRAIGIDPNEGDAVADTAPEAEPAPLAAPAADAAQAPPLAQQPAGTTTKRISQDLAQGLLAAARDMLVVWEGVAHPDLAYRPGSPAARLRDLLADAETPQKPARPARQGTAMPLMAIPGTAAGNRFCVIAPAAKATGLRPGERDGLGQMDITFQLDGADSPVFLAQF
jgi:hypothetical protein